MSISDQIKGSHMDALEQLRIVVKAEIEAAYFLKTNLQNVLQHIDLLTDVVMRENEKLKGENADLRAEVALFKAMKEK